MSLQDRELEQHYQDLFEMYASHGWKRIQEQFAEMFASHNTLAGLNTEADLNYRKGQLDIIGLVISHQDQHERAYNELVAGETGGEPEAPTGGVAKVIEEMPLTEGDLDGEPE